MHLRPELQHADSWREQFLWREERGDRCSEAAQPVHRQIRCQRARALGVCYRRMLPVTPSPRDVPQTHPTAAAQVWQRELVKLSPTGP